MRPAATIMATRMTITVTITITITITVTVTTTRTDRPMPRVRRPEPPASADALLQLMWLASPALPVGGFSYSEVLEAAVDAALVRDETQARAWLLDQLQVSLARSDL